MVYECRQAVQLPIIGMGGIATAERRARVHDRRRDRRPGRHRQLRRSVPLAEAPRRPPAPTCSGTASRGLPELDRHARHTTGRARVDQLLIALDVPTGGEALQLADALRGSVGGFKIGSRLFTAEGPAIVRTLAAQGRPRLPRPEVPRHSRTPSPRGGAAATSLGVWMVNVHAVGRRDDDAGGRGRGATTPPRAEGRPAPLVIAVTVLTSMNAAALRRRASGIASHRTGARGSRRLAQQAGLDGVVASPQETSVIRALCGAGVRDRDARHPRRRRGAVEGRSGADDESGERRSRRAPATSWSAGRLSPRPIRGQRRSESPMRSAPRGRR